MIDDLLTGELVLLELLYRLAARGAEADGDRPLMLQISLDADLLRFHLTQRAELAAAQRAALASAEVSGNA